MYRSKDVNKLLEEVKALEEEAAMANKKIGVVYFTENTKNNQDLSDIDTDYMLCIKYSEDSNESTID